MWFAYAGAMPPITADLREIAAAADSAPEDIIQWVVDRVADEDRSRFLQGLTERVLVAQDTDDGVHEVHRWIGSWVLSLELHGDPRFVAADDEANKLLACGKFGDGVTGAELRQRYR